MPLAPHGGDAAGLVVKVGGSLFGRSDWPALARDLLDVLGSALPCTFVIGGGAVVDGLRAIDARVRGDDRLVHRLAIDGMGITARYVANVLGLPLVTVPRTSAGNAGRGSSHAARDGAILDMAAWLDAMPEREAAIPHSWSVTSDTLAAHVAAAHHLGLLLAKSVPPPPGDSLEDLARTGWIDAAFPGAANAAAGLSWCAPIDRITVERAPPQHRP